MVRAGNGTATSPWTGTRVMKRFGKAGESGASGGAMVVRVEVVDLWFMVDITNWYNDVFFFGVYKPTHN